MRNVWVLTSERDREKVEDTLAFLPSQSLLKWVSKRLSLILRFRTSISRKISGGGRRATSSITRLRLIFERLYIAASFE